MYRQIFSFIVIYWTRDNVSGGRTLTGDSYTSDTNMTSENCIAFCNANNFVYAGTEYAVCILQIARVVFIGIHLRA